MTALRFFRHLLSASQFGGSSPYSLSLTPALQSEIAYAMVSQFVPDFSSTLRIESASQMVSFLSTELNNPAGPAYSILIRNSFNAGSEGHVVTPIGVTDLGGGRYQILIYDSNHPSVTRAIDVNENTNSWRYELFPGTVWSGAGGDNLAENPMILDPLRWVLHRHPCPFCSGAGTMTISLGGDPVSHGHLLITTSDGRHLGFLHGRFVNQIKGARVLHPYLNEDWKAVPEPIYEVPARDRVTVTLGPSRSTFPQTVDVSGPGFGATVSNLMTGSSAAVQISLAPISKTLGLRVLGHKLLTSPTIDLTGGSGRTGDELLASPRSLSVGALLQLTLTPASNRGSVTSSVTVPAIALRLTHVGSAGSRTLQSKTVELAPSRPATF
jgi:hypothetical protein